LQKVERKNIKYRENNRVLSEAVQGLENRNISSIAGSGGANQDPLVMYDHVLRETNEDMVENMDYIEEGDINLQFEQPNNQHDEPRNDLFDQNQQENSNAAGLFNTVSELNSGDRRIGYFDNAQDEATGGEGHTKNNIFEEEKNMQINQQYSQPDPNIDQQASSLV